MEGTIKPPAPLSDKGNMAENWMRWKKDLMIFLELSNYNNKPQDIKAYLLRNYIGEVGLNVLQKLVFKNIADRDNMSVLLAKLDAYFNPVNEVVARHNFFTCCKQQNESIEDYVTSLKKKAETCNFGNLTNSLIRDQIIATLNNKALRKKLFEVQNLDLSKLVSMYNEHNVTTTQNKQSPSDNAKQNEEKRCRRCKQKHPFRQCPAWNFKCETCSELHHYTHCCPKNDTSRKRNERNRCNPNENKSICNMNLKVGNAQEGNTLDTQAQRNTYPSAPPVSDARSRLYPDLRYANTFEGNTTYKMNENFQNNAAPLSQDGKESTHTRGRNTNVPVEEKVENSCTLS